MYYRCICAVRDVIARELDAQKTASVADETVDQPRCDVDAPNKTRLQVSDSRQVASGHGDRGSDGRAEVPAEYCSSATSTGENAELIN